MKKLPIFANSRGTAVQGDATDNATGAYLNLRGFGILCTGHARRRCRLLLELLRVRLATAVPVGVARRAGGGGVRVRKEGRLHPDEARYSLGPNRQLMLGGGARASTRFVEVDNTARSEFFDVHRLRHIIEPNSTLWWGWDSLPDGAFPL